MARTSRIKWTKRDIATVTNVVRQFNAKITRVSRRNPVLAGIQPERLNNQAIQQMLRQMTRQDFNRWLGRTRRYLKAGAEMPYTTKQGVNTTVWQFQETTNDFRSINARRKAELKRLQPSTFTGTMGAIEQLNLRPRKNTVQEILPRDWERFVKNVESQSYRVNRIQQAEMYTNNYIEAIRNNLGFQPNLENLVRQIPPEELYDLYASNPMLQIDFIYSLEDVADIVSIMQDALLNYINSR